MGVGAEDSLAALDAGDSSEVCVCGGALLVSSPPSVSLLGSELSKEVDVGDKVDVEDELVVGVEDELVTDVEEVDEFDELLTLELEVDVVLDWVLSVIDTAGVDDGGVGLLAASPAQLAVGRARAMGNRMPRCLELRMVNVAVQLPRNTVSSVERQSRRVQSPS